MGDLMDHCGNGLHLTHAFPNGDLLFGGTEIPVKTGFERFHLNGDRGGAAQRGHLPTTGRPEGNRTSAPLMAV